VYLPGTGGKAGAGGRFNAAAAGEGYHVVSLQYPDGFSISHVHQSPDPDAFAKAREGVVRGGPVAGKVHVTQPNCIENRLTMLLRHLAKEFPAEGWKEYLTDTQGPAWEKLVLAGSSQGGGHAAYMAMRYKVARVVMFGAPKDFSVHFDRPAKWFGAEGATPVQRFFSFVHSADEGHGCSYRQQLENYRAMGLSPKYPVVEADRDAPPGRHSRLLTSKPGGGGAARERAPEQLVPARREVPSQRAGGVTGGPATAGSGGRLSGRGPSSACLGRRPKASLAADTACRPAIG
jgi:pimeloyl-ACP methyl ester carboxylesterase